MKKYKMLIKNVQKTQINGKKKTFIACGLEDLRFLIMPIIPQTIFKVNVIFIKMPTFLQK